MTDPTLLEIIDAALYEKGYKPNPRDPDFYDFQPDGEEGLDLMEAVRDCLERGL